MFCTEVQISIITGKGEPHATGPGSTPFSGGGELRVEATRLPALEETVQGMALDAELQVDHRAPDDMALFNVVTYKYQRSRQGSRQTN
jgi:hypothetical protein